VARQTGSHSSSSAPHLPRPVRGAGRSSGSLRGHLEGGAKTVVQSSPYKSKQKGVPLPDDATMLIHGINHFEFDPAKHKLVSAASCTTTALAHMMRPLLDRDLTRNMITAGMSTVHSVTNSSRCSTPCPRPGATDLRKNRGALDNIVLTSTNAAAALEQVMPEMRASLHGRLGAHPHAEREPHHPQRDLPERGVPDGTVSVERDSINAIYEDARPERRNGLLKFSTEQNVSRDMLGENAAVVIEGVETHTRTGFMNLLVPAREPGAGEPDMVRIPLTHVKIFGWYDNEMGSYTYRLGELTEHVARSM